MAEDATGSSSELDLDAIVEILKRAPVTRGILFGSYASGDEHARSDVDVAVEFEPGLSSIERTRARLSLIERLSVTLERDAVDVIPLSTAPSDLRREIASEGIVLIGEREPDSVDEESTERGQVTRKRFDDLIDDLERVV